MALFPFLLLFARSFFAPRLEMMAEILALRQQLAILNRTAKRPSLRSQDRLFWIALSRFWRDWRSALLIVKPETVIKWHRQGFRLYWRWKSKAGRPGRPRIDAEIRVLAIVPLRSIEDGLLRRDSYDSLQTGHQLSTIQIATTKRKLASAQSIKAVFIRKMNFLLWTGSRAQYRRLDKKLHGNPSSRWRSWVELLPSETFTPSPASQGSFGA
jgi:hypothetical protein